MKDYYYIIIFQAKVIKSASDYLALANSVEAVKARHDAVGIPLNKGRNS